MPIWSFQASEVTLKLTLKLDYQLKTWEMQQIITSDEVKWDQVWLFAW